MKVRFLYLVFICCVGLLLSPPAFSEDALSKANYAVANILFEYDGADEFAAFKVNEDGFVDITFARNTPDKLYGEVLTKLQNHPDINGVLSGKGGPTCKLW